MTQQEVERACNPQVGDEWRRDGVKPVKIVKVGAGIVGLGSVTMSSDWLISIEDYKQMVLRTINLALATFAPASEQPPAQPDEQK